MLQDANKIETNIATPFEVILISGPGGSGKSSTAAKVAEENGWKHISEDDYWTEIKTGHPFDEPRTSEEQTVVQSKVMDTIRSQLASNRGVVLEFILYEDPPLPLMNYQKALDESGIVYSTRILCPTEGAILERMRQRGRIEERDEEAMIPNIRHQLECLQSPQISEEWRIDTTGLNLDQVIARYFRPLLAEYRNARQN